MNCVGAFESPMNRRPSSAAYSSPRAGAGLVTLGIARSLHAPVAARVIETTFLLLPHETGVLTADAAPLVALSVILHRLGDI